MAESERYARQRILPQIGDAGQELLVRSSVAVVGAGALGCVSSMLMCRAGLGKLRIIDRDVVEVSNLQRQLLFDDKDVDRPKAEAAAEKLSAANPKARVQPLSKDLNSSNIRTLLKDCDLILDGTDNMETRFLVNDFSISSSIPWVYAGAIATYGNVLPILPRRTACFRCVHRFPPPPGSLPTCETAGILPSLPSVVAGLQATEAIRILLGQEPSREMIVVDIWSGDITRMGVLRSPDCPACVNERFEFLSRERKEEIAVLCGRDTVSVDPLLKQEMDLEVVSERLKSVGEVRGSGSWLAFRVGEVRITLFKDGRALIRGVKDVERAKSIYDRYVGR